MPARQGADRANHLDIKISPDLNLLSWGGRKTVRRKKLRAPQGADTWLVIRKAFHWLEAARTRQRRCDRPRARRLRGLETAACLPDRWPVNVIGAKVLLTSGSITASIDRLEARSLVKRNRHPTERSAPSWWALTPAGT